MRKLMLVAALCASGVGFAQPPKTLPTPHPTEVAGADRAVLEERMAQLQLAMLVDSVLNEDVAKSRKSPHDREAQSASRKSLTFQN